MAVRPAGPGDLEAWWRMRRALWPDAVPGELIEEAHFRSATSLAAVFLGVGSAGEPLGMLELSLRSLAEGCRTMRVPYVEGWYVARPRRAGAASGGSS